MLRKYCHEMNLDWDEGLPFLLFAISEVPHESTGISPFELVFGRKFRGTLMVIKDKLLDSSIKMHSVSVYLEQLKDNLAKIRKFAKDHLEVAQGNMKTKFDSKSQVREFKEGEKVLASSQVLLSEKYHGPYTIKRRQSNCNYILNTPDRRKDTQLVHVNLLKPYLERPAPDHVRLPCNVINTSTEPSTPLEILDFMNNCGLIVQIQRFYRNYHFF